MSWLRDWFGFETPATRDARWARGWSYAPPAPGSSRRSSAPDEEAAPRQAPIMGPLGLPAVRPEDGRVLSGVVLGLAAATGAVVLVYHFFF